MKAFSSILFITFLACALADRDQCPHPEDAGEEVVNERVAVSAPEEGFVEVEVDVDDDIIHSRVVSCATVVSSGEHGGPFIISYGKNRRDGYSFKLVSGERAPIEALLSAYIPGDRPGPGPNVRAIPARFY